MSDRLQLALRSISDSTVTPEDAARDATHLVAGDKESGTVTIFRNGVAQQVTGFR
jgi:hypothetical protein